MQGKIEQVTQFLQEKTKDYEAQVREGESLRRQLRDCSHELENLKDSAIGVEGMLRKETEELRTEVDNLAELVNVKDRMLDD